MLRTLYKMSEHWFFGRSFCCSFDLIQQLFSYVWTDLPLLNHYEARINVTCSRTQRSDADEARTRNWSVSRYALDH